MKNNSSRATIVADITPIDVLAEVDTDDRKHARKGWMIILLGLGSFLLWGALAPLDQGVPMPGTVTVASNRKAIQHQAGGTVQEILVKEGDKVKAGQVLVRMNEVQAKSLAEISRIQYYTARAAEVRLAAERDGRDAIDFPAELVSGNDDPRLKEIIRSQELLFGSRRLAIRSELAAVEENIAGLRLQVKGLQESRNNKQQQAELLKEQLAGMRELAKEGYVARNRLLEIERTYAQVNGAISEDIGNVGRLQRQISELLLRRTQRQQEYQKEVRSQLADMKRDADSLENRLKSQDYDLANVLVKSPVEGTVVGMNVFTNGGVVPPGFKMMDVVPSNDELIVEAQAPVHLIDKLHPELPVEMIFSAFNQRTTPSIPGIVTQVSADRLVDEKSGTPYYRLKAKVNPKGMKLLEQHDIRPGMPVELFVKTGERTMLSYLFKPILDRANTALREE